MSQSIILTYADTFGLDREEVKAWVMSYIKRPGEFPRLIELGLIEDTEEKRKESIQKYLTDRVAESTAGRIKSELFEERAAIREHDGQTHRIEAEKLAEHDERKAA